MTTGRPRSFDTDRALEQAMQVFWRLGYEGASLAELTKAMGINAPSLYAAFGSKEGLFKAVLDHYAARRDKCVAEVLAAPTAREAVDRLLSGLIELVTDPDEPPGCLLLQGGLACGVAAPGIPEELMRRRAGLETALHERFVQARNAGDLPAAADPAALARYFAAVCNGIAVQAASGAGRDELRQIAKLALLALPG
ncbi:MAG TPA: TetR/AcrR family transcriptional regulator [Acetobacteraceae bacterium]